MWLLHDHGSVFSVSKPSCAHYLSENLLISSKRGERMECSRSHHLNASNSKEETSLRWAQRRAAITAIQTTTNDITVTLDRVGEKLLTSDLNLILRYFGSLRRWEDICQLFHWMEKHGNVTASSYTSFITLMGKARLPKNALELYCNSKDTSIKSNVIVCNAMLKCLISNGRFETAFKLFEQMQDGGLIPDIVTYSTLLSACIKMRHGYSKAQEFLKDLKGKGLKLDVVMYGSLLAICASHDRDEEAEAYFQQMKNECLSANEFHYSSLLNAYAAKGKYEKAEKLIDEMKSSGIVPNKMPYCTIMHGLAEAGKIEEAQKVFNEMKIKGIKSDGYSYSVMISSYSKIGDFEKVKKLAMEMESIKVNYDLAMMNTLLKAYSRVGDMESVMRTLKKMDKLKISPNWITFSTLISYFCEEELYDLALHTLEDMQIKGHQPTEKLCSPLITGLRESGRTDEVLKVYNQLKCRKRQLS
ncbi:pentatricopeptide repeat-containing protein At1g10910, chloroplastic isoform X2 [Cryptomeria japonica]|uniref:pentatricopeptide repeat-containing protein At1g10910, chloroplastic isoform X2 n=1 Tax=Cryptomeria japonica TaxID=3369 RepID=UPI0025AD5968|nr:pentatricopeptide repeat-containing protein At1g10910, chloroplastic isoform X2 [Cryptomeria japonica]